MTEIEEERGSFLLPLMLFLWPHAASNMSLNADLKNFIVSFHAQVGVGGQAEHTWSWQGLIWLEIFARGCFGRVESHHYSKVIAFIRLLSKEKM